MAAFDFSYLLEKNALLLEDLKRVLAYDPHTGIFTWKKNRERKEVGSVVKTTLLNGYVNIQVFGQNFYAHQLAIAFSEGKFPPGWVDHLDKDKTNNRLINLRKITPKGNAENRRLFSARNKSGFLGVEKLKRTYRMEIASGDTRIRIGKFKTAEEAAAAYRAAKEVLHADWADIES